MPLGSRTLALGATIAAGACVPPPRFDVADVSIARVEPTRAATNGDATTTAARTVACEVWAPRWAAPAVPVSFDPGTRPFARVSDGEQVRLTMFDGSYAGGLLRVDAGGAVVRGYVRSEDVTLHPARPFLLLGMLVPTHRASLQWTGARESGVVLVRPLLGPTISTLAPLGEIERSCDDVSTDERYFDSTSATGHDFTNAVRATIRAGATIPVRPGFGLPPELTLRPSHDVPVRVAETTSDMAHVLAWVDEVLVRGWIPLEAVDLAPSAWSGAASGSSVTKPAGAVSLCADTPLFAAIDGRRESVGYVRRGTEVRPSEVHGGWLDVRFEHGMVVASEGASLSIRSSELVPCSTR